MVTNHQTETIRNNIKAYILYSAMSLLWNNFCLQLGFSRLFWLRNNYFLLASVAENMHMAQAYRDFSWCNSRVVYREWDKEWSSTVAIVAGGAQCLV
jgi:hypothetical protein